MNTWVGKNWLYSIRIICLTLLISFVILSCKKRIKEVEVTIYDVQSKKGIEGISIYHNDSEYQSDANGQVFLPKKWNYRGEEVFTNFGFNKYFNPEYNETCELKNEYEIENEFVNIPVSVSKVVKLVFTLGGDSIVRSGCFVLDDLPNCQGDFRKEFSRSVEFLDVPGIPGWDNKRDYLTFYTIQSSSPATLSVYYDCKEGWDNNAIEPDIYEEIELDRAADTTYYTLVLK